VKFTTFGLSCGILYLKGKPVLTPLQPPSGFFLPKLESAVQFVPVLDPDGLLTAVMVMLNKLIHWSVLMWWPLKIVRTALHARNIP